MCLCLSGLIPLAGISTTGNWKDPFFDCFLSWMLDLNDVANAEKLPR